MTTEHFISVDIETAGPIPGDYALLSIGACSVLEPRQTFYIEFQPTTMNATPEASAIHQLSLERLLQEGLPAEQALLRFEDWLRETTPAGKQPTFVAFNAAFDWMFINYYFMHFLGRNPFGHAAIDIKAFYMGLRRVPWSQTSWRHIDPKFKREETEHSEHGLTHHALQDALDQADLFKRMLEEQKAHISSNKEQPHD